jgi:hypothetical protein
MTARWIRRQIAEPGFILIAERYFKSPLTPFSPTSERNGQT